MACVLVSWREIREGALTMIRFLRREILRCWVFGSREEAFQEKRVRASLLRVGVGEGVDGVLKSEVIEGCIVLGFLAGLGGWLESGGLLEGAFDSSLGGGRGFMKERIDFWALPPRRFPWRRMGMSLGIPRAERGPEVEERGLVAHVRKKVSSGSPECWETREWSSRQVKSRILGLSGREVSSRSSIQIGFAALGSMKSFNVVWSSTSSVSSMEKAEVSSRGLGERSDEVGTGGKQLFLVELSGGEEY